MSILKYGTGRIELIIRERLGIRYLRPYQTLIIRHILDNMERDKNTYVLASSRQEAEKHCVLRPRCF